MRLKRALFLGLSLGFSLMVRVASAAPEAASVAVAPNASAPIVPASATASTIVPSDASSVRIIQARAVTPNVAVYLDIRSEAGKAIPNVKAEQLQADIGPYRATAKSFQTFASTGEGIATVFLVDVSKSLKPDQLAQIRSALVQWTEKMGDKDLAAIVSFGESVKTVQDFTADKAALKAKIGELALVDLHTRLNEGLIRALDLGRRDDANLPHRRVIVTLTDGIADAAGGSTREDTLARIKEEPVPIYAIGFAATSVSASDRDRGFKLLGAFAHASGGAFMAAGGKPFEQIYADLSGTIREANLLMLECATCPGDGRAYPLRVKLQADQRVLTATSEVRLVADVAMPVPPTSPALPQPAPGSINTADSLPMWLWLAGGIGVIAGFGVLLARRKKTPPVPPPALAPTPEKLPVQTVPAPVDLPVTALPKPGPGILIQLTAVSGAHRGREWRAAVGTESVIGRAAICTVVIDDDSEISSKNTMLSADGGLLFVDDMGSTNGTAINGSPIKGRRRVSDGDLILVGRTELRLTILKAH